MNWVVLRGLFAGVVIGWAVSPAFSWWDTQLMVERDVPKVAEVEAEAANPTQAQVVDDLPPFGPAARGGRAVRLEPGRGFLSWQVQLRRSVYVVFVIARAAAAAGAPQKKSENLLDFFF